MYHDISNTSLELEFSVLALNLRNMWYQHGYTGLRYFKQHIADIYKRFQLLVDEDNVDPDTVKAAENACTEMLALQAVPNETWLPYVKGIKRRLSESSGSGGSSLEMSPYSSPQESPTEEKNFVNDDGNIHRSSRVDSGSGNGNKFLTHGRRFTT